MGKYQKKRKTNLTELDKFATSYGTRISLEELKKMCEDMLFKFENHINPRLPQFFQRKP